MKRIKFIISAIVLESLFLVMVFHRELEQLFIFAKKLLIGVDFPE